MLGKKFKYLTAIPVLLLSMGLLSMTFSEKLEWKDWNSGYPEAMKNRKIALIDVYTDWCGWCKKMDRDTYTQSQIVSKLNKDFVSIKFNPEVNTVYYIDSMKVSGPQLLMMLSQNNPTGYPTTYFLIPSKQGNSIYVRSYPGYHNAADFEKVLDEVLALAKN